MSPEIKNALPSKKTVKTKAAPMKKRSSARKRVVSSPFSKEKNKTKTKNHSNKNKTAPVKLYFLGGLDEIGKNITAYEYGNDIIIVDCGMAFPESDMPGVDLVIPDFTFLINNKDRIKGIFLTHGHEDHIGSLPYLLKSINVPIYGSRLTLALVMNKLREHNLHSKAKLNEAKPGDIITLGNFKVEFIRVNHSIPDAVGFAISTPAGVIVQTGDFKIDCTPIHGEMLDIARFSELGKNGVLALLSDSTNAERPGYTKSERTVGRSFDMLFKKADNKRIIIATFASNIHRIQQIMDAAYAHGRKVAVSGRSMINVVSIAVELGYLKVPSGLLIDIDMINRYTPEQLVLITTGSQGEPMSALSRMAFSDHRKVAVGPQDMIIISATPIPGNEKTVTKVVNELLKHGCEVIYEKMYEVHSSGHACQEELKLMMGIVKPQYFIPVHGERKHLIKHAELAQSMGIPSENILIADLGYQVEISNKAMKVTGTVPSGHIMVDGLGVGDVGSIVLRDRKHLSEDGIIIAVVTIDSIDGHIVSGPDIISRGFVYVRESEQLMDKARMLVQNVLEDCADKNIREWGTLKSKVKDELSHYLYEKTKRSPMILPVIMEI